MTNSNYGKTYDNFTEHPLAPIYFKYIDILISRDLNQDIQYLLDIAHSPITEETTKMFTDIIAELIRVANEDNADNINEFEELGRMLDNAN